MTREAYEQRRTELSVDLESLDKKYLTERGWVETCANVGGLWLWKGTIKGEAFQVNSSTALHLQEIEDNINAPDDDED